MLIFPTQEFSPLPRFRGVCLHSSFIHTFSRQFVLFPLMTSVFLLNGCSRFSMQTDFVAGSTSSFDAFLDDFFPGGGLLQHDQSSFFTVPSGKLRHYRDSDHARQSLRSTLPHPMHLWRTRSRLWQNTTAMPFRPSGQLTYDVLQDYLKTELSASDLTLYDEPLRPTTGIQSQLPVLYEEYRFRQPADVEDYLALLTLTGDYFDQIIRFEQQKAQAGLFMSDYACNTLISQCSAFTADPDQHYLIQTFDHKIDAMSELMEEQKTLYKEKNAALVREHVLPAYTHLAAALTELLGSGKNDMGLCYFADGKDYYRYLVCHNTGSASDLPALQDRILEKTAKRPAAGGSTPLRKPAVKKHPRRPSGFLPPIPLQR